jgi:hypothetical protein
MFDFGCANDAMNLVRKRDSALTRTSVRLMHVMPRLDHGKAERELGWRPAPVHDSIRQAAEFYRETGERARPPGLCRRRVGGRRCSRVRCSPVHSVFDDEDEPANA